MRIIILFLALGFVSANFYEALEDASNEAISDFFIGMQSAPSLKQVCGLVGTEYAEEADKLEEDLKSNLVRSLKTTFDEVIVKLKQTVEQGKELSRQLVEKARDVIEKLKAIGNEVGSKAQDFVGRIRDKVEDFLRAVMIGKRGIIGDLIQEFSLRNILNKLKEKLNSNITIESARQYIRKMFGELSLVGRTLIRALNANGIQAVRDIIARLLGRSNYSSDEYSLMELWERVKGMFKGLGLTVQEKFFRFANWARGLVANGIENMKDKMGKMRALAVQVIAHGKEMSKEIAEEALEFFRPYSEDLGLLWDELKETVQRIVGV